MSYQSLKPFKRGKWWKVRFRRPDGSRPEVNVGLIADFPKKESAILAAEKLRSEVNAGQPVMAGHLFGSLIDLYIAKEMPKRHSTRKAYSAYIEHHIRPQWSNHPIASIRPLNVRVWLEALPLAPKSKSHVKSIMYRLFETAMLHELIPAERNPIELVRLQSAKRLRPPTVLNPEQCRKIREAMPVPFSIMVLIVQCFGLRASEMLALKWSDFDFDKKQVTISRGVVDGVVGDVKTEYSNKPLPMADELAETMLLWREASLFQGQDDWVFASPFMAGEQPYCYTAVIEKLRAAGGKGLHVFRHTYKSLLSKLGTPVGIQKDLMRHSDVRTTMNQYGGTLTEDMREANNSVARLVM